MKSQMTVKQARSIYDAHFEATFKEHRDRRFNDLMQLAAGSITVVIDPNLAHDEKFEAVQSHYENLYSLRTIIQVRSDVHGSTAACMKHGACLSQFTEKNEIEITDPENHPENPDYSYLRVDLDEDGLPV